MSQVTLTGKDVYNRITIRDEALAYSSSSRLAGMTYHVGILDGMIGFSCTNDLYLQWVDGNIAELVLDKFFYEKGVNYHEAALVIGYCTNRQLDEDKAYCCSLN